VSRLAPPEPSDRARLKLLCVEHARRAGVATAVEAFGVSRATVSRWRVRFVPADLTTLEDRARRPRRTGRHQWSAAQERAVLAPRTAHPRMGKAKLRVVLAGPGLGQHHPGIVPIVLSESMIGRILASLRRRRLLVEPRAVPVRRPRPVRSHAARVPTERRQPTVPGALVLLDTMHPRPLPGVERRQFTAIDVVSRWAVLGVRAQATAATAFLAEVLARFPFPVRAIQVDGGTEFMAGFEAACQAQGIALYVLPPRGSNVQRPGRTPQRDCPAGVLAGLRRRAGPAHAPPCPARLRGRLQYRATPPGPRLLCPHNHLAGLSVSHVSN